MDFCGAASAKQVEGASQLDKVFSVSEKCRSHCFAVLAGKSFKELCLFQPLVFSSTPPPYHSIASEDKCLFTPGNKSTNCSFIPIISA